VERLEQPAIGSFRDAAAQVLIFLLQRPGQYGLSLTPEQRSDLYLAVRETEPSITVPVYHLLEGWLERLSRASGMAPERAFPPPPGLEEFREELRRLRELRASPQE
jgi:hypothetical protein